MGSFSWLKADKLTNVANIVYGELFKLLIPKEFGGGFIKDVYQDYGRIGYKADESPKYDMYELLAFWNHEQISQSRLERNELKWKGKENGDFMPLMKEIDEFTDKNRGHGIDIGCYDNQIDKLKYPLKLVSVSYSGTYEDCEGRSYGDPNQGFGVLTRDNLAKGKY